MEGMAGAEVVGRGNNLYVKHGDDSGLIVKFYLNKIYEKTFVEIMVPGDSKTKWDRPVKDEDKLRFHRQWQAFQAQQSQFGGETMLESWELVNEGQVNQLKSFNIFTVENLCNMPDGLIDKMGPGSRDLNRKAKVWLAEQKEQRANQVLKDEITKRDTKILQMEEMMQKMQDQIGAMAQDQSIPKRRGRKPKGEVNDSPN